MRRIPSGRACLTALGAGVTALVVVAAPLQAHAAAGPSGLWGFSVSAGTSRVSDLDGNQQNMTLVGNWSAGVGQVTFNGTPSYGTVSGATFSPGDQEFAFGAVLRTTRVPAGSNPNVIQAGMGHDAGQYKIALKPANGGTAVCVLKGSSANLLIKSPVTGLANGAWHEIVCSRQGRTVSIAVDGVTSTFNLSPGTIRLTTGRPLLVAGKGPTTTWTDQVIGSFTCAGVTSGTGALAALSAKMPC
jgi:Laminin G domain